MVLWTDGQNVGVAYSSRRFGLLTATLVALVATGCGDDPQEAEDDRTSVSWLDTDVCALVDAVQVTALIGPDAQSERSVDNPRRPECEWAVPETTQRLVLRLWQPPVPDVLADEAKRMIVFGDHTGYVESEGDGFCNMHVAAEPAWLTVDLNVPFRKFRPHLCEAVSATVDQVLAEVK